MESDVAAIVEAICCKWSNGVVEGHVDRLKMLKRQKYGHAWFRHIKSLGWDFIGRVRGKYPAAPIFSSTDECKPREVMKLYSRRMQIEQNFRDEKSERFGFGLRGCHRGTSGSLLATAGHSSTVAVGL